ncbi:MAG: cyclic pyranopterin monophosphate synthase MoaC [Actinobacteria bacterium]|nr:cyclic pyranopterin monophosphate synthase MoaC [Actinomycetota bacterium]MTA78533.1 cyclic pyranopterin monophosphate synthase MoaC [Actinomycetota bacterium]
MSDRGLTHLDPLGRARMVDVTPKEATHRRAIARGRVYMTPETTALVARGAVTKGDVLAVARVAGIQAAKRTSDLIPLCHPLLIGGVYVNFRIEDRYIEIEAQVETVDRTGVEMEALTACTVAALTVYDMCKSSDREMVIGDIALWEKTGGRHGAYRRDPLANMGADVLEGPFTGSGFDGGAGDPSSGGRGTTEFTGDFNDDFDDDFDPDSVA